MRIHSINKIKVGFSLRQTALLKTLLSVDLGKTKMMCHKASVNWVFQSKRARRKRKRRSKCFLKIRLSLIMMNDQGKLRLKLRYKMKNLKLKQSNNYLYLSLKYISF